MVGILTCIAKYGEQVVMSALELWEARETQKMAQDHQIWTTG